MPVGIGLREFKASLTGATENGDRESERLAA